MCPLIPVSPACTPSPNWAKPSSCGTISYALSPPRVGGHGSAKKVIPRFCVTREPDDLHAAWKLFTIVEEHRLSSSESIEVIAMPSNKSPLLICRQLGQTSAVGSILFRFRYTISFRRPQSTLNVPTSRTTRRPFSYPYHLRANLPTSFRTIFIQTESTPNVDVSQPNL